MWELSELFCSLDFSNGAWLWIKWTEIWKVAVGQNKSWTGQQGEEKNGDKKMGQKNKERDQTFQKCLKPGVFWLPLLFGHTLSNLLFLSLEHSRNIKRGQTR